MQKLINTLYGKKTYIVALVMAIINLLVAFEVISPDNLEAINYVLVALGFGAVRAGISKVE